MHAPAGIMTGVSRRPEWLVLGSAIGGVALALGYSFSLTGEHRDHFLYYNVPIAAPFAAFLVERWMERSRPRAYLVDASVVALALARVLVPVPMCSGHVLFTSYAALSSRSRTGRLLSLLVLVEVIAIKLFLWGDFATLAGGLVVAVVASLIRRSSSRGSELQHDPRAAGPYRTPGSDRRTPALSRRAHPAVFAMACCAVMAISYQQNEFDPARWRASDPARSRESAERYRTVRAARAAARRARGATREDVTRLLGGKHSTTRANTGVEVRWFRLSEPCGSMFSMADCGFAIELEHNRVVAAWLHDSDGAPWRIECLYGCGRDDMRARMTQH